MPRELPETPRAPPEEAQSAPREDHRKGPLASRPIGDKALRRPPPPAFGVAGDLGCGQARPPALATLPSAGLVVPRSRAELVVERAPAAAVFSCDVKSAQQSMAPKRRRETHV